MKAALALSAMKAAAKMATAATQTGFGNELMAFGSRGLSKYEISRVFHRLLGRIDFVQTAEKLGTASGWGKGLLVMSVHAQSVGQGLHTLTADSFPAGLP